MNCLYPVNSLKDDVFEHLDMVFRSARKAKNHAAALRAVEISLKAKHHKYKTEKAASDLGSMSEKELGQLLQNLQRNEG